MHEGNRTEISTLGEFGLIKHLTQDIKLQNPETKYGCIVAHTVFRFRVL